MTSDVKIAMQRGDSPYSSPAQENQLSGSLDRRMDNHIAATARITYSGDYLIDALSQHRAHRNGRIVWLTLRIIAIVSFGCFTLLAVYQRQYTFSIFLAAFTVLLIVGQQIDNWRTKRAFASSPHLNEELTLHLSDTGFHAWSTKQDTRLQWALFTRVVYCDGGVLIFQGPTMFHWIPWSAFAPGSDPHEIEMLLRSRISQHHERRTSIWPRKSSSTYRLRGKSG